MHSTQLIFLRVEFKNGQYEETENIVVSDIRFVRDYFLKKIASAIDLVHPARRIKITFPEGNKYLKMRRAYCQNCGNLLKEFYGFYEGRIEESYHCNKLTVLRRNPKGRGKMEAITLDEKEIIEKWRMLKRQCKGHLHVSLKSNGSQFYLETTSIKEGQTGFPGFSSSKENS